MAAMVPLGILFVLVKEDRGKDEDKTGTEDGGAIAEYGEQDVHGTYPPDRVMAI